MSDASAQGPPERMADLAERFGGIDVYLFDQLLRGRVDAARPILDAGCGSGRNSLYLMKCGCDVFGVDADREQVARIRALAAEHAPHLPEENFRAARLTKIPFPDGFFGSVICNAVLHFAEDEPEFHGITREMWRVLAPGGLLFTRLASSIGIEERVVRTQGRRHRLPDGSDRFLVDAAFLRELTESLGARMLDPLKTTVVQDLRSMTTWVVGKPA